jgi:hypothetical protein
MINDSNSTNQTKISSKTQRRNQYKKCDELRDFILEHSNHNLMTTRFNEHTWKENEDYRSKNPKYGCIYPSPEPTNHQIDSDQILFVLEMNNDTNQIMGIGMVKNTVLIKKHRVYSIENYNRYAYLGKHRIDRKDMTEDEMQLIITLDTMCFKGSRHLKRLQGIKKFPTDRLYIHKCETKVDIIDNVINMFKQRFAKNAAL